MNWDVREISGQSVNDLIHLTNNTIEARKITNMSSYNLYIIFRLIENVMYQHNQGRLFYLMIKQHIVEFVTVQILLEVIVARNQFYSKTMSSSPIISFGEEHLRCRNVWL